MSAGETSSIQSGLAMSPACATCRLTSSVPFDFQKQLQELGKDPKGNRDVAGEKVVSLHVELEHHIAGQDGTGGVREYAGSDGTVRKPRVGTIDRGLMEEQQLLALQGKGAATVLQKLCPDLNLAAMNFMTGVDCKVGRLCKVEVS